MPGIAFEVLAVAFYCLVLPTVACCLYYCCLLPNLYVAKDKSVELQYKSLAGEHSGRVISLTSARCYVNTAILYSRRQCITSCPCTNCHVEVYTTDFMHLWRGKLSLNTDIACCFFLLPAVVGVSYFKVCILVLPGCCYTVALRCLMLLAIFFMLHVLCCLFLHDSARVAYCFLQLPGVAYYCFLLPIGTLHCLG